MRLLAVPLLRRRLPNATPMITYVSQQDVAPVSADIAHAKPRPSLVARLTQQASQFWRNLGRDDVRSVGNWRKKLFVAGEGIMDRIDHEEWALKTIDAKMGPAVHADAAATPATGDASAHEKVG